MSSDIGSREMNNIHNLLIMLANNETSCSIAHNGKESTWATLFRYQPLLDAEKEFYTEHPDSCYVFEIGRDCGTVFSERLVDRIEMTSHGGIIHLK
jgi:hypothetical protein